MLALSFLCLFCDAGRSTHPAALHGTLGHSAQPTQAPAAQGLGRFSARVLLSRLVLLPRCRHVLLMVFVVVVVLLLLLLLLLLRP